MILEAPIKTEKAIGRIEFENTITFRVSGKATKPQVKSEVEKMFGVKVRSVRTYITPSGEKMAVVRLGEGSKAEDISSKLRMV